MAKRNSNPFILELQSGRVLFLDGAMGTMLQAAGMPVGVSPDLFCLENPEILMGIHLAYVSAGSDIITTCTFGANSFKLPAGTDAFAVNRDLARIAREAAARGARDGRILVAGDVGPTGHFIQPLGPVAPREMIDAFKKQIAGLAEGGVDLIFMETQFDLAELRAAVVACREVCDLPVMVSMTFESGTTLTGSTPEIYAQTLQNMDVDVIGTNCSLGPDEMRPVVEALAACCSVPVMAEPNAGLPQLADGKTVFPQSPEQFAEKTASFVSLGARVLGGCCGTTPDHIKKLCQYASDLRPPPPVRESGKGVFLSSRSRLVNIRANSPLKIIGERVNPTGKPILAEQLRKGEFQEASRLADEQLEAGADILDINVGAPLVDETLCLPRAAALFSGRFLAPLSLDSSNPEAIAAALPFCPGSPLVNSISGEPGRMEILAPLCKMYGAPFVLLPLSGGKLPETFAERADIVARLVAQAEDYGIRKRLILVDALALAVSSSPDGGKVCLETLKWCRASGLATTLGLSNISFGLPARPLLNSAFLCMAFAAGLESCIANPVVSRLREARDAINVLMGFDRDAASFIDGYAGWKNSGGSGAGGATKKSRGESLFDAVVSGDRENALEMVEKELAKGKDPFNIVNESLIPAITEVGVRYEKKEYFLPQLIRSAETMQKAFERLKPLIEEARGPEKRPVVVLATVEGDIHDIGKNIVALLLGNHGFDVVDLGKDVPAAKIVDAAESRGAKIIGLSALMTTTMTRMEDTIRLVRERGLPVAVLVGGAAVTPEFADSIGADAYCEDAVSGARAAKKFAGME